MDTKSSYRKPYIAPVKSTWWLNNKIYLKYIIRELTSVFAFWVTAELLVICIFSVMMPGSNDPSNSINAQAAISDFIQNPIVIALNILSLAAILFHTVTWFNLMPKAVRFFRSSRPEETRLIPPAFWISLLWGCTAVASVIITLVLFNA